MNKINSARFIEKYNKFINDNLKVSYIIDAKTTDDNCDILVDDIQDEKVLNILQELIHVGVIPQIKSLIYGDIQYSIQGIEYDTINNIPAIIFHLKNEEI